MQDCIFCKIVAGELPSDKVYEDENVYAFKDIDPQAPVHVVIVPKKHYKSVLEVEDGTVPTQLASEFTPSDLRRIESFKAGTEPTEVSTRFSKLSAPTNGSYNFSGSSVNLSWTPIKTPDSINPTYLQEYFNKNYEEYATKYYDERLNYNRSYIGNLGYNIYQKDSSGNLTYLGRTDKSSYVINNPNASIYVIKAAYSIFTANISDGLEINIRSVDQFVDDMLDNNDDEPSNNKPSDDKLD